MVIDLPLHRTCLPDAAIRAATRALHGDHLGAPGPIGRRAERWLEAELGVARAVLTTSGTMALELAALLLDLRPGDEVLVPSFTFVTTASAFARAGARPVFCDVDAVSGLLDPEDALARVTPRTRAVVPVHYGGAAAPLDRLLPEARALGLEVVEDAAHGLFGRLGPRCLGSLGRFAMLSFHETKNVTSGEGGALLLERLEDVPRAEVLRDKGTNRTAFFEGAVDAYSWVAQGSSFGLAEPLAALLLPQFEAASRTQARRRAIDARYREELASWAAREGVCLPPRELLEGHAHHLFHLVMPDATARVRFMAQLASRGVGSAFHYTPLHLSAMGRRLGGRPGQCPRAEALASRVVRIPLYPSLDDAQVTRVVEAVTSFRA